MNESLREKALKEPLHFKNVTVLLSDPRMDNYWDYWIPQDDLDMEELKSNFAKMPGVESVNYYFDHERILQEWIQNPPEFVFNQCDEGYQNDEAFEPHLTAYMDMLGVPFTGPTTQGLVLVKDKSIVRGAAQSVGVPVPVEVFIQPYADIASSIPDDFPFPAFGKLGNASGSMGVIQKALAHSKEEAVIGLTELRQLHPDRPLLLQEFLSGREFSIAMVGNPELGDFEVFPPVEVDYSGLDKSKYAPVQLEEFKRDGDSEFWQQTKEVRADLTDEQMAQIKDYARRMFVRTQCRDYARMDFRTDSRGQIKIMDVNPNCWLGGKYRMMAEWAGYAWPEILVRIVKTAQKRFMIEKVRRDKKRETFEKNKKTHDERIANHITFATNGNSLVTNLLPQERS